jgi:radical SAM protein with 4Fe4S-binding SPASM domain
MCPNKELPKNDRGFMSLNMLQEIVDQSKSFIYDLTLHHRGESLLNPQVIDLITYASKYIQVTKLHTNGTQLTDTIIKGILESNLARISFSFDGFCKDDYEKIRVGADYYSVVENIRSLLIQRKQKKKKTPLVAIEVIDLQSNPNQGGKLQPFIKSFRDLGLDQFVIKKPHNWAGYLSIPTGKKHYSPCTFLWNALLILWNGNVVPCAQDFFAKNIVGNIANESIASIWNNTAMMQLRKDLIQGNYQHYPACANCDRLWRETFLGIPKEYLRQIISHKMP